MLSAMTRTDVILAFILALPFWLAAWLAVAAPRPGPWQASIVLWGVLLVVWRAAILISRTGESWRGAALAGLILVALLLPFVPLVVALAILACCLLVLAALARGRACAACGAEPFCATLALPPVLWMGVVALL